VHGDLIPKWGTEGGPWLVIKDGKLLARFHDWRVRAKWLRTLLGDKQMNLLETLAGEIHRVTVVRCSYEHMDGTVGFNVKPVMDLIDAALGVAFDACAKLDTLKMMHAVGELKRFEE
jgi:hypothetical protein